MTAGQAAARLRTKGAGSSDEMDVAAYCARPACNREFRRVAQPGRRQLYCTEECRRKAEHEVRQLRSRLRDLEASVAQQHRLLAAYGAGEDEQVSDDHVRQQAAVSLAQAGGVIRFLANSEDPLAVELIALYDGVKPLIDRS